MGYLAPQAHLISIRNWLRSIQDSRAQLKWGGSHQIHPINRPWNHNSFRIPFNREDWYEIGERDIWEHQARNPEVEEIRETFSESSGIDETIHRKFLSYFEKVPKLNRSTRWQSLVDSAHPKKYLLHPHTHLLIK